MGKRIGFLLVGFILAIFLFAPKACAVSELDQHFENGESDLVISQTIGGSDFQTFKPKLNVLNKVGVEISGVPAPSGTIGFTVKKWNGTGWTMIKTSKMRAIQPGWNYYVFSDVGMTLSTKYAIVVRVKTDASSSWKYNPRGSFLNGSLYVQNVERADWDANFRTYGYNSDNPPAEDATAVEDDGESASSGAGTNVSGSPAASSSSSLGSTNEDQHKTSKLSFFSLNEDFWASPYFIGGLISCALLGVVVAYLIFRRKKNNLKNE